MTQKKRLVRYCEFADRFSFLGNLFENKLFLHQLSMMIDYGQIPSPCYVVDEERLERNLQLIRSVSERAQVEIIMAFKAFAMYPLFPIIRNYVSCTTASSLSEARLAKEEFGSLAHTYAPVYDDEEFFEIMDCSSHITFNSLTQFHHFAPRIRDYERCNGRHISCGLRLNPEYSEVETDLYNPCAPGSRLGITADQLPDSLPDGVDGLHFHTLCESSAEELSHTLNAFEQRFSSLLDQVQWVNMGGGHLMTRQNYDLEQLIRILTDFKRRHPHLHIILEPGAAFVWQTGELVSTVLDIVENHGIRTAMLNVSFACHMPDCLEMPYKPAILGALDEGQEGYVYRMGGNSCLSGDYVGTWTFDHVLQVGERIVFMDMIHYTFVKTTMFNGVSHPGFGIWRKTGSFQLLRKFGYEDYKCRMG